MVSLELLALSAHRLSQGTLGYISEDSLGQRKRRWLLPTGGFLARKRIHKGSRRQGRAKVSKRPSALLTGTLSLSRPGVATVSTPEGTYALAKHGIHEAMHGDEVQVSLVSAKGKTPLANVRFVLTRATQTFLGIYHDAGPLGAVVPLDSRIQRDFFVLPEDPSVGRHYVFEGDVVVARITEYPTRKSAAVVTIERRVGSAEDLDMNVEATIASYGLATEFPIKAQRQAEKISVDADKALAEDASRHDLREDLCITVDPADAKDFDDAVGARKLEDGSFELWVHIADVAHYVKWDSPIDLEARMRTCSAYLVDRVLPMLPEKLCNDVCSLRPAEDRLAMSVKMTLSSSGKILGATAMNSVIRSRARLSYDQVDGYLQGDAAALDSVVSKDDTDAIKEMINVLNQIRALREKIREKRGSVDFESVETRVVLDQDNKPIGVSVRERTQATGLIEEAMLAANESVAHMLSQHDLESAYRVHEQPSPESLKLAVTPLVAMGALEPDVASRIAIGDQTALQEALESVHGTRYSRVVNAQLLRAQKRAIYLPTNQGHFALGADAYCHFTSPIRRYPDVIVHRTLKRLLRGQTASRAELSALPDICSTCSEQERKADAAARATQKIKLAEYYQSRLGEETWGTIDGCERFGLFITLDDTYADGLLAVRDLGHEWYVYDQETLALIGESTGKTYRIGGRVRVKISGVNVARGQIDLALVE